MHLKTDGTKLFLYPFAKILFISEDAFLEKKSLSINVASASKDFNFLRQFLLVHCDKDEIRILLKGVLSLLAEATFIYLSDH